MSDDLTALQCVKIIKAKGFKKYCSAEVGFYTSGNIKHAIYMEDAKPYSFFNAKSFKACMKLVDKYLKENPNA